LTARQLRHSQSTHRAYRLDKHPRFHIPCTPTYSSRINQIGRWFAELTRPLLERDYRRSVHALERDVRAGIIAWNQTQSRSCGLPRSAGAGPPYPASLGGVAKPISEAANVFDDAGCSLRCVVTRQQIAPSESLE
jgi:hypothetical protein